MKHCLILLACVISRIAVGQSAVRPQSAALPEHDFAYIELLGSGLNISANIERVFLESNTVRIGIGAY